MNILLFHDRAEVATTATSVRLDFVLDEEPATVDALHELIGP